MPVCTHIQQPLLVHVHAVSRVRLGAASRVTHDQTGAPGDAGGFTGSHSGVCSVYAGAFQTLAEPSMAAEDFSLYGDLVPTCFVWLGIRNETLGSVHALHNPNFLLDDGVLPVGAGLHASLAVHALHHFAGGSCKSAL